MTKETRTYVFLALLPIATLGTGWYCGHKVGKRECDRAWRSYHNSTLEKTQDACAQWVTVSVPVRQSAEPIPFGSVTAAGKVSTDEPAR